MTATETEKPASAWARFYAYLIVFCVVTLPIFVIAGAGYVLIHFIIKFW